MAEEYLSINDSTLQSVADAIKSKAGIASNTKLAFPDGFKSALQGIDAYAPAKKIAAATTTLTPSNTSYPIPAGVHTGSGKVRILTRNTGLKVNGVATDSNTITPSSVEQVVLPTGNYFLQTIYVNAMDASGYYQVVTGTKTVGTATRDFYITGLPFKPVGFSIMLQGYGSNASQDKIGVLNSISNGKSGTSGVQYTSAVYGAGSLSAFRYSTNVMKTNSLEISGSYVSSDFYGTYFYMIWGH